MGLKAKDGVLIRGPNGGIATNCACCGCGEDPDCPEGYECRQGVCYPKCTGDPCTGDDDCPDGCVCFEGNCFPASDMHYCTWPDECEPNATGSGNWHYPDGSPCEPSCGKGRPEDPSHVQAGPFSSYEMCCFVGCGCSYLCNPVSYTCYPDPEGVYADEEACMAQCGDPGDMGRCCQSIVCYDQDMKAISYTTGEADVCPSTREWCRNDPPVGPGECRTFRTFNTLLDCSSCPVNSEGPCCLPEGCVMGLDRLECEDAGGEHKGTSWIDCETPRDPSVGQYFKTACPDCNGQRDCFCDGDEKCVNQNCEPCGDHVFPVTAGQKVVTGIAVKPGDLVDVYVRSCRDDVVLDDADREVRLSLNDAAETFLSLVEQEATGIPVTDAGDLVLSDSLADIIVCITVHPAAEGACCFFDDFTQAHACADSVTAEWCSGRTDGVFYEGKECGEIDCPASGICWYCRWNYDELQFATEAEALAACEEAKHTFLTSDKCPSQDCEASMDYGYDDGFWHWAIMVFECEAVEGEENCPEWKTFEQGVCPEPPGGGGEGGEGGAYGGGNPLP